MSHLLHLGVPLLLVIVVIVVTETGITCHSVGPDSNNGGGIGYFEEHNEETWYSPHSIKTETLTGVIFESEYNDLNYNCLP
jgi:hypothetical protein